MANSPIITPIISPIELTGNSVEDKASHFRQYTNGPKEAVCNHYREMRKNQTYEYNLRIRETYSKAYGMHINLQDTIKHLEGYVDLSDPDTSLGNIHHAFQSAEMARKAGKSRWFQLVCLIHDFGKMMYLVLGNDEDGTSCKNQWAITGDTFIVGCGLPDQLVYPEFNLTNPDMQNPKYSTNLGVYAEGCGLDATICSWGHDEFCYRMLQKTVNTLPNIAYRIIRYHSLYCWHQGGAYAHLMNSDDDELLEVVREFNSYDLYSKEDEPVNLDDPELMKYYEDLFDEFFQNRVLVW